MCGDDAGRRPMSGAVVRKLVTVTDEIHREMERNIIPPTRRAAAAAVIKNPFVGRYVEDLTELIDIGAELGSLLGERAVTALGVSPSDVESYGKAALVGVDGELEHAAAILHPKLGAPLRSAVEKGAALVHAVPLAFRNFHGAVLLDLWTSKRERGFRGHHGVFHIAHSRQRSE